MSEPDDLERHAFAAMKMLFDEYTTSELVVRHGSLSAATRVAYALARVVLANKHPAPTGEASPPKQDRTS